MPIKENIIKVTENGKYRKFSNGQQCDCIIGLDQNSESPRLLRCKNPTDFIWFWREWIVEIIRESKTPIYSRIGVRCCQECFNKIKDVGPPSDLEKLRKKWADNNH